MICLVSYLSVPHICSQNLVLLILMGNTRRHQGVQTKCFSIHYIVIYK